jgi:hypothetical protein
VTRADLKLNSVLGGAWRIAAKVDSTPLRDVYRGFGPSGEVCIKLWRGPDSEARVARVREVTRMIGHRALAKWRWDGRVDGGIAVVEDAVSSPWAKSPAPPEEVAVFLDEALELLAVCHAAGVVHGGIAPWRIGRRDGGLCMRGFDRALLGDSHALRAFAPPWTAPEHPELGPRADLFSLGVVALFLFVGAAPAPDASALELAQERVRDSGWLMFFESAVAPDAADRWPNASAMRRGLRLAIGDNGAHAVDAPRAGAGTGTVLSAGQAPPAAALPFAPRAVGTGTVFSAGPREVEPLPFGRKDKPVGTSTVFAPAPQPVRLPFADPVMRPPAPEAARVEPAAERPVVAPGTVFAVPAPVVPRDVLPFREPTTSAPRPEAAPEEVPPVEVRAQPGTGTVFGARAAGLSTLPFGDAANAHAVELASDQDARLPLERYAAVRAAIWRDPERCDEILAREGIDRIAWHCYEARALRSANDRAKLARLFDAVREPARKK